MLKWAALLLVSFFGVVVVVEEPRFMQCNAFCSRKDARNKLLLSSSVCKDDYMRSELDGDHVSCTKAQEEVDLGVTRCSIRKYWKEGEPAALYHRVLGSPYMIYALLMPATLFFIYQVFAYWNEQRRENKWFAEQHSFVESFLQLQNNKNNANVPVYTKEPRERYASFPKRLTNRQMRHRRKSSYHYNYYDDRE